MEFAELIRKHAAKVNRDKGKVKGSEANTINSLIEPFFNDVLGYDIANPDVARSEVQLKRYKYADIVLCSNGKPAIIVEAKESGSTLNNKDYKQLYTYFTDLKTDELKSARLAILTNGVKYHFYSDLDKKNTMDAQPFITVDFANITDKAIKFLQLVRADTFEIDAVLKAASGIRIEDNIKSLVTDHLSEPSDAIVREIVRGIRDWGKGGVSGKYVDKYRPMVKAAINDFMAEYAIGKKEEEKPPQGTKRWTKESFFNQVKLISGAENVKLCDKLLQFFESMGCEISWGTGKRRGGFVPVYNGKQRHSLGNVYNGYDKTLAAVYFGYFKSPLNTTEYKQGIKSSLERIGGVKIKDSELGKYPSLDISLLSDEKAYRQFTETMKKYIEDIKAAEAN